MKDEWAARRPDADPRAFLSKAVQLNRLSPTHEPRVFAEGVCGHVQYRCLLWRPENGFWNSGALLRDFRQGDKPLPTVIALWPEGCARISEHSAWIHRTLKHGFQVLVMDVAASGALVPARLGNTSMYVGWSTMYNLNAYLMQLGDSLCGVRTRQMAAAADMLRAFAEADGQIALYARDEMSRCAEMAALLAGVPVCADSDYQTWTEIVQEDFHDQTNTHAWVLPGALQHCDAPQIHALLEQSGLIFPDPSNPLCANIH